MEDFKRQAEELRNDYIGNLQNISDEIRAIEEIMQFFHQEVELNLENQEDSERFEITWRTFDSKNWKIIYSDRWGIKPLLNTPSETRIKCYPHLTTLKQEFVKLLKEQKEKQNEK